MTQQDPKQLRMLRRQAARQRRARARIALAAVVCAVVVIGFGALALARAQSATRQAAPKVVTTSLPSTTPQPSATVAPVPAAQTATTPPVPADITAVAANTGGADVVAKAAVDFPNAPSIKPTSLGTLKPKHKYIAITLDDGYGFQPEMLALLQKYDARCTTFVLGGWAADNTSTLKKLDAAGFEIANHTWDHKTLTNLSADQERSELLRTQKVISAVTGNQAPYMRPPGGATNARVKSVAADLGYRQIMWTRTFADSSKHASPENSYHWVMEYGGGVRPGDIILCHWGSKNTLEAMKRILPELKAQGYEFVTVSELIADSKPTKK